MLNDHDDKAKLDRISEAVKWLKEQPLRRVDWRIVWIFFAIAIALLAISLTIPASGNPIRKWLVAGCFATGCICMDGAVLFRRWPALWGLRRRRPPK
jgi:lipopolysaccharide export LptBFGC system permease protein LptF